MIGFSNCWPKSISRCQSPGHGLAQSAGSSGKYFSPSGCEQSCWSRGCWGTRLVTLRQNQRRKRVEQRISKKQEGASLNKAYPGLLSYMPILLTWMHWRSLRASTRRDGRWLSHRDFGPEQPLGKDAAPHAAPVPAFPQLEFLAWGKLTLKAKLTCIHSLLFLPWWWEPLAECCTSESPPDLGNWHSF